jgi:hypothetical protein
VTTPNQGKPTYGSTYDDYAYEVGGGPWHFGQGLTQDDIELIIHGPRANTNNVNALFQDKLLQLPNGVLQMFQGFIPDTNLEDDFTDVPKSVSTIMQWLPGNPLQATAEELQKIIDSIIQGFNAWWEQNGFSEEDVAQFSNTVGTAIGTLGTYGMRLENLEKANAVVLQDFATYANNVSSLGSNWVQWYTGNGSGTLGSVNGFAVPTLGLDTSNKWMFSSWKNPVASNHMRVASTISTPAALFGFSENLLLARLNPEPGGDCVFAGFTAGKSRIGFFKDGQITQLKDRDFQFRNGSIYTLDVTEDRTFRLFEGSTEILSAVDAGGVSSFGPGFQSVGFGMFCPNGIARPGVVGSFATYLK